MQLVFSAARWRKTTDLTHFGCKCHNVLHGRRFLQANVATVNQASPSDVIAGAIACPIDWGVLEQLAYAMSVLIALTTPDQPARNLLQIIDSYAPVGVASTVTNEPVAPGRISVSPPNKHLSVGELGVLRIEEPSFLDRVVPSVYRLFSAAAVVYGKRLIGVVLSGNQYDGVQGMKTSKQRGE